MEDLDLISEDTRPPGNDEDEEAVDTANCGPFSWFPATYPSTLPADFQPGSSAEQLQPAPGHSAAPEPELEDRPEPVTVQSWQVEAPQGDLEVSTVVWDGVKYVPSPLKTRVLPFVSPEAHKRGLGAQQPASPAQALTPPFQDLQLLNGYSSPGGAEHSQGSVKTPAPSPSHSFQGPSRLSVPGPAAAAESYISPRTVLISGYGSSPSPQRSQPRAAFNPTDPASLIALQPQQLFQQPHQLPSSADLLPSQHGLPFPPQPLAATGSLLAYQPVEAAVSVSVMAATPAKLFPSPLKPSQYAAAAAAAAAAAEPMHSPGRPPSATSLISEPPVAAAEPAPLSLEPQIRVEESEMGAEADGGEGEDALPPPPSDAFCSECDDGGLLVSCDGTCMQAFHVGISVPEDGPQRDTEVYCSSHCNALAIPEGLARMLIAPDGPAASFKCPSCLAGRQQCFVCKQEGWSTHQGAEGGQVPHNREVYSCISASCGRFYHPACVGKAEAECQDYFLCDLHQCKICGGDAESERGELVQCRRCPCAYHTGKCMPKKIANPGKNAKGLLQQRLWLGKRDDQGTLDGSLLYCMRHTITELSFSPHTQALFSPAVLDAWKEHYFRLLPQRQQSTPPGQAPPPKKLRLQKAGAAATAAAINAQAPAVIQVPKRKRLLKRRVTAPEPAPQETPAADAAAAAAEAAPAAAVTPAQQASPPSGSLQSRQSAPAAAAAEVPLPTPPAQRSASSHALPKSASKQLEEELLASAAQPALPGVSSSKAAAPPAGKPELKPGSKASKEPTLAALREKLLRDKALANIRAKDKDAAKPGSAPKPASKVIADDKAPADAAAAGGAERKHADLKPQPPAPSGRASSDAAKGKVSAADSLLPRSSDLDRRRSSQAEAHPGSKLKQGTASRGSEQAPARPKAGLKPGARPVRERDAAFPEAPRKAADLKRRRSSAEAEADRARSDPKRPRLSSSQQARGDNGRFQPGSKQRPLPGPPARQPGVAGSSASASLGQKRAAEGSAKAGRAANPSSAAQPEAPPLPIRWLPFEKEENRSNEVLQANLEATFREIQGRVTPASILKSTFNPENTHGQPCNRLVTLERVEQLARSLVAAKRNPKQASTLLNNATVRALIKQEDQLQMALGPMLHHGRYTSYGRHFTTKQKLIIVNSVLLPLLLEGDMAVDSSCGANEWVPDLRAACLRVREFTITGKCFDIICPANMECYEHGDWFNVEPYLPKRMFPEGQHLIMGLNPPFGKDNILADKFVFHMAKFRPRLIVLIVPAGTKIPLGYKVLFEDNSLMGGHVFYIPGADAPSWCKAAPAFRILVRSDWFEAMAAKLGPTAAAQGPPMQNPGFLQNPGLMGMPQLPSGDFGDMPQGPGPLGHPQSGFLAGGLLPFQPGHAPGFLQHDLHPPPNGGFRPEWGAQPGGFPERLEPRQSWHQGQPF